jgi:hypothetical protein
MCAFAAMEFPMYLLDSGGRATEAMLERLLNWASTVVA